MASFWVQKQENDPYNPGWWRFGRPVFHASGEPPEISEATRWRWASATDAAAEQEKWDRLHSNG